MANNLSYYTTLISFERAPPALCSNFLVDRPGARNVATQQPGAPAGLAAGRVLSAFLTVQLVDARRQQENLARQEARNLAALLDAGCWPVSVKSTWFLRSVSPRLNPVSLRHNPMPANARLVAEHALEQALPLAGFADHLGLMNVRGELIYQTGRHPELLEAMSREYFIRMRRSGIEILRHPPAGVVRPAQLGHCAGATG